MSKKINCKVGNLIIGGSENIVIQSMCNTDTLDVEASVAQCKDLYKAGCQMARLTTQGLKQVEALAQIKAQLLSDGIDMPLVADVHFNAEIGRASCRERV